MIKRLRCVALRRAAIAIFPEAYDYVWTAYYVSVGVNFLSNRFEASLRINCITRIYEWIKKKHACTCVKNFCNRITCSTAATSWSSPRHTQIPWFTLFIYSVCFIPHKTFVGNFSYFPRISFLDFRRVTRCLDCNDWNDQNKYLREICYIIKDCEFNKDVTKK